MQVKRPVIVSHSSSLWCGAVAGPLEPSRYDRWIIKNVTWPRERLGLCPWLLGGDLSAPGVSASRVPWAQTVQECDLGQGCFITWYQLDPQRGWRHVSHVGSWLSLCDQVPVKIPDTKASLAGNALCMLFHAAAGTVCDSMGRGQQEAPGVELSWTLLHTRFPLADFNLYSFAVINCN